MGKKDKRGAGLKKQARKKAKRVEKKQEKKQEKKRKAPALKADAFKAAESAVFSSRQEEVLETPRSDSSPNNRSSSVPGKGGDALVRRGSKPLAKTDKHLTVGSLEASLLKMFPADTAEPWDRTGLLVGERSMPIEKVAITLDPTVCAIEEAAEAGAQLLLTHHPAYLQAPDSFSPGRSVAQNPGAGVWAAISAGVALMDFHTALDVSRQAQAVLPNMLGLVYKGRVLQPLASSKALGYGQVCSALTEGKKPQSLSHLAARCTSVFGRAPRVWGSFDAQISQVVTATGSASDLGRCALEAGIDCLICGEIHYHDALELSQAGLCIIELGHDASEFPLTAVLADAVAACGVDSSRIVILDQTDNWLYPESIRL